MALHIACGRVKSVVCRNENVRPPFPPYDSTINGKSKVVNLPFMGWEFQFEGVRHFARLHTPLAVHQFCSRNSDVTLADAQVRVGMETFVALYPPPPKWFP